MQNTANKLQLIYGDCNLGVKGEGFHYIFSHAKNSLESLNKNGKEWLYRLPLPTYWRAETDNDRGNGFAYRSGMWIGADLFQKCVEKYMWVDGEEIEFPLAPVNNKYSREEYADSIDIKYVYETCTNPVAKVDVNWHVACDGRITVHMYYHGQKELPELPLLGMRFIMPTKAVGFEYKGLSGETYPDRMAGGVPGIYKVEGLPVVPHLVPQDCGVHMNTEWVEITRNTTLNNADHGKDAFTLRFEREDANFAFSCLPYTAEELENANHMEELPPARRTVLSILAKVRGVGGIDSWGADVEEAYHISAEQDYELTFSIQ